tara:strand:- start:240 stop:515 length:276 start_codon:yes stop_codon:yes gene_type:complete
MIARIVEAMQAEIDAAGEESSSDEDEDDDDEEDEEEEDEEEDEEVKEEVAEAEAALLSGSKGKRPAPLDTETPAPKRAAKGKQPASKRGGK